MKAVDNTLMIAGGEEWPELTCSAVWGGKLSASPFTYLSILRSSAVCGSRTFFVHGTTETCEAPRTLAVRDGFSGFGVLRGSNN